MRDLRWLLGFVRPYALSATVALMALTSMVVMDLAIPRLVQRIIDEGIGKNDRSVILSTALVMLALTAASTVIAIINNVLSVRVGESVARDIREALFLKIQAFSFGNLDRRKTGQLMVRLTSDVAAVKALTQITLRIGTRAPLLMLGSLALMVATSRSLALTMIPLLLVTLVIIAAFVARTEPLFRRVQQKLDAVNNVLQENIAGARLVKALVRDAHEEARFEVANRDMTAESIGVMRVMAAMTPALTLCVNAGVVVVIWVGGLSSIAGELSVGQVVAFSNYLLTTMSPLIMMTMLSNTWAAGLASLRRMDEIVASDPDVHDAPGAIDLPAAAAPEVGLDDVSFAYDGERKDAVVQHVSLTAAPGRTIAILGATGAGKSTLVQLIPRFYDATTGAVRAFGRDVRDVKQASLISRIGMVPQEAVLFSGTVRDNIRYGRPDALEVEVLAAARAAQAHDFIAAMPDGYDSRIEPRGVNLSGGQKQRLAIARALLVEPAVLILDDSTSAVDVETETRIQSALAATKANRTTFVVTQRISTALDADAIIVLDRGRVVAEGTHRELMERSAVYREIYDSQLGEGPYIAPSAMDSLPPDSLTSREGSPGSDRT